MNNSFASLDETHSSKVSAVRNAWHQGMVVGLGRPFTGKRIMQSSGARLHVYDSIFMQVSKIGKTWQKCAKFWRARFIFRVEHFANRLSNLRIF